MTEKQDKQLLDSVTMLRAAGLAHDDPVLHPLLKTLTPLQAYQLGIGVGLEKARSLMRQRLEQPF